jgi:hypothetical protein
VTTFQKGDEVRLRPHQHQLGLRMGKVYVVSMAYVEAGYERLRLEGERPTAWWYANRFYKVDEEVTISAKPITRREKAVEYLAKAEERASDSTFQTNAGNLALVGILQLLLDEPKESGGESLVVRYQRQAIAAGARVDELTIENEQLKEKADVLEAELLVAKQRKDAALLDQRAAINEVDRLNEEIARLNREQGVVPTRAEAVAEIEGFSVEENGNAVRITDEDGDSVVFERPITHANQGHFIFAADIPGDGVYITRAQWLALTRQAGFWAEANDA